MRRKMEFFGENFFEKKIFPEPLSKSFNLGKFILVSLILEFIYVNRKD